MDFLRELTVFPSAVHRNIYSAARQITPQGLSICGMEDGALKDSCKAFWAISGGYAWAAGLVSAGQIPRMRIWTPSENAFRSAAGSLMN